MTDQRKQSDLSTRRWASRYPAEIPAINEFRVSLQLPMLRLFKRCDVYSDVRAVGAAR